MPGEELLGSITSTQQGTITMQQPANEPTLRSLRSAGSKSAALSGCSARALSIRRHTRPSRLVRPQVEDLIEIYRRRGFDQKKTLAACFTFSSIQEIPAEASTGRFNSFLSFFLSLSLSLSPLSLSLSLSLFSLSLSLSLFSLSLSLSLSSFSLALSLSLCLSLSFSLSLSLSLSP